MDIIPNFPPEPSGEGEGKKEGGFCEPFAWEQIILKIYQRIVLTLDIYVKINTLNLIYSFSCITHSHKTISDEVYINDLEVRNKFFEFINHLKNKLYMLYGF